MKSKKINWKFLFKILKNIDEQDLNYFSDKYTMEDGNITDGVIIVQHDCTYLENFFGSVGTKYLSIKSRGGINILRYDFKKIFKKASWYHKQSKEMSEYFYGFYTDMINVYTDKICREAFTEISRKASDEKELYELFH